MSSTPTPQQQAAMIAGRYSIQRKLGSGSMGTVYLALDQRRRRPVALKVIRTERLLADPVTSMQREYEAIARLRHPRIAAAYDFGYTEAGRIPFYTREYVQGTPLPPGPPADQPPGKFLRPILDLLEALEHLHENGILHLDIHAGNLIVAEEETRGSVLIDIGWGPPVGSKGIHQSAGTWTVMPPELSRGESGTARSDLFAVGRLLHYRLTGQTVGEPRLPREIPGWGTGLTLALERILAKAVSPRPQERFASAAELREALELALGSARSQPPASEPAEQTIGRDGEISQIEEALRRAASGERALVWFTGRIGLGKTRLLSEARLRAQFRGLDVVDVRFFPDPGPEPPLRRALEEMEERADPPAWLEALSPSFGGTPLERARRAAEAFFAQEGSPLVLIADDVDRADGESRAVLEAMAARSLLAREKGIPGRGLALIFSSTTAPPGKIARSAIRPLPPLSSASARRLLSNSLRTLELPGSLRRRILSAAKGRPLLLRQIAAGLVSKWGKEGRVPAKAPLPDVTGTREECLPDQRSRLSTDDRRLLEVLEELGRPVTREELAVAVEVASKRLEPGLRRLARLEIIAVHGKGRGRRYQAQLPERERPSGGTSGGTREAFERKALHRRLARYLEERIAGAAGGASQRSARARDLENLSRHWLLSGDRRQGLERALEASRLLRERGSPERAVLLLRSFAAGEKRFAKRLELGLRICAILEETGDHEAGISVLEPIRLERAISPQDRVGVSRRLGISYHRAGLPSRALEIFREAQALADPERDLEDLLLIDCELAELHIFSGAYDGAMEACERGIRRIETRPLRDPLRRRVEVLLRASRGHIHLRRMELDRARRELEIALGLSRRNGTLGDRAAILQNLGVTENHLSNFPSARRRFLEAERLLVRAGEHGDLLKISTNLAVTAAKLGARDEAYFHLHRAERLLRLYPGQRFRCFEAYSRGLVAHLFGEVDAAIEAFQQAIDLAAELGDTSVRNFARVYQGESHLLAGRYSLALPIFRLLLKETSGSTVLSRVVLSRLFFLEQLLHRTRTAQALWQRIEGLPRSDVDILEAWNDLFLSLGRIVGGRPVDGPLDGAVATFQRMAIPAGLRFARLVRLLHALLARSPPRILAALRELEESASAPNAFLAVAEAIARADAHFLLGESEKEEACLAAASGAIVGCPFLELDWRIELTRTRITLRRGDPTEARRHLHRALHSRDLLLQFVPPGAKRTFLSHPRFAGFDEILSRLSPVPAAGDRRGQGPVRPATLEAIVGDSPAMRQVLRRLETIAEMDAPVLIQGETGTGKELLARAVHDLSRRRQKPLRSVHCACLPEELFESELFGHLEGSFTGAERDRPGLLLDLEGGTFLFDEVSELSLASQAKLLRVVESGVVRLLGSVAPVKIDVRFLATTSSDLKDLVEKGRFRADLYYRLRALELTIPPLAERREDIPLLVEHFLQKHSAQLGGRFATLTPRAMEILVRHDWPGNVRELETLLLRALTDPARSTAHATLDGADLEPHLGERKRGPWRQDLLERPLMHWRSELEREYLTRLFLKVQGDVPRMAAELGVKRTKLYEWLRKLGIDPGKLRREGG